MRPVYIVNLNTIPFLPYIYGLLRSYSEKNEKVKLNYFFPEPFFYNFYSAEEIVQRMDNPAVVGLSCYIWNFKKSLKVARLVKEKYPAALVVAGGPQIPDRVGTFLQDHPYLDLLVHGEGEKVFTDILMENLQASPQWSSLAGVSYRELQTTVTTKRQALNLSTAMESPYLAGYLDKSIELCQQKGIVYFAPWETNRGCPFSCTFCDWGSSTMSKVRDFNLDRLYKEIDFFGQKSVPKVHINDANFGMLKRDIDIANYLVNTKKVYGFPQKMYLNFAKNSNDKVFEISQLWHQSGLLENTTLSMQATNDHVLAAIKRKNIPIEQYEALQKRYSEAGIHTYTEVILGLPEETLQSFKKGLDRILETGNHDDIRVYELSILPNAPIADPEMMKKYSFVVVDKEIIPRQSMTEVIEDEIETIPTVVQTNTLTVNEWIDCSIYSKLLQCLHSGYLTRYVAIYLHDHFSFPYHKFYEGLQNFFKKKPDSILGKVVVTLHDYYVRYVKFPPIPRVNFSLMSKTSMELLSSCDGFLQLNDQLWLCIVAELDVFYDELKAYLDTLQISFNEGLLQDLLIFQKNAILTPACHKAHKKTHVYSYDWLSHFVKNSALVPARLAITYGESIEYANLTEYIKKALPMGALSNCRGEYYQHTLDNLNVFYPEKCEEIISE